MTRNVAGYVRVSTDDQNADRQRESILRHYDQDEITWFVDIESGASLAREQYQDLRNRINEFDIVTATEIDRLGRSFSELANFAEELENEEIALHLTEQPIDTRGEDDWMNEMMLRILIVFADAERKMIRDRVQQGIEKAKKDGKRLGKPPMGYTVEDGFMVQIPSEYYRVQEFIREVKRGREKRATAEFYSIPQSSIQSILERSEQNYEIPFDNDQWRVQRARVEAGEVELDPLDQSNTGTE